MRLSSQLYFKQVSDRWHGIYSPFGHKIAFVNNTDLELLKDKAFDRVEPAFINYLLENNIIVEDNFEHRWLKEHLQPVTVKLNSLYLITTTQCNLACKYCVVLGNKISHDGPNDKMTVEVGLAAIKKLKEELQKNRSKHGRVTFYGGEPLLNQDLILALIPEIDQMSSDLNIPIDIVVITNGYIFSQKLVEVFKEHKVGLAMSIDGWEKHHNEARVNLQNEGTYEHVISNFKKYQDAGIEVNITTTVGSHNVKELPAIAEFFAKELKVKMVEFQIPCDIPGKGNGYWVPTSEITSRLMEAFNLLKSHDIHECTTSRRMENFVNGTLRLRDCGSSGSQIVVAPDGSIGPCHSLVGSRTYFKGNVLEEFNPNLMENFVEWANRYPLNIPGCQQCPFISLCGGGCIYNGYIATGSIWGKDPQVCDYMKEMVSWILQNMWDKMQDEK